MMAKEHKAVFIDNQSNKQGFIQHLLSINPPKGFEVLKDRRGGLFSKLALDHFIEEEVRHDRKLLTKNTSQSLQSMSSGERKKAMLQFLLNTKPHFLILDNPFDNLDTDSQEDLKRSLKEISRDVILIQLVSRSKDLLSFISDHYELKGDTLLKHEAFLRGGISRIRETFKNSIPKLLSQTQYEGEYLIQLNQVSVRYGDKPILQNINWNIGPGEFWQLKGKNGSGKSTLLSLITGDNPKAYGQELYLFGQRKGSGESVWDIKKNIGYFTPAMIDRFTGYHSLENMLISGLMDSIGLYIKPTEVQIRLAQKWLEVLDMAHLKTNYFHELSMGQQRLLMCARAMIKQPLILILDEPTASLDDKNAELFVALVNKIAEESNSAIIFVSHRDEPGLLPQFLYALEMSSEGSRGHLK